MHPTINIAKRAALAAGRVILRNMDRLERLTVSSKGRSDLVSEVDLQAEREIIQVLRRTYPDHAILAEESGRQDGGDADESQWIIDPLDGTTNFLHGLPQYAVSIAFRHKGRLESGVVYDPVRQEIFVAARGRGAMLNDHRIRVRPLNGLEGALLGTGFPLRQPRYLDSYLNSFKAVALKCHEIRRAGSAALDLSWVACGRLDGFWEIGLNPWDMAAGVLLIQEAGGLVGDFAGGHDFLESGNVVAGSPKVFKGILQEIRPHMTAAGIDR